MPSEDKRFRSLDLMTPVYKRGPESETNLLKTISPTKCSYMGNGGRRHIRKLNKRKFRPAPQQDGIVLSSKHFWDPMLKAKKSHRKKVRAHIKAFDGCEDCVLCSTRRQMVFYRGIVPCDVLFIGEAPGEAEDVLGEPFVGPSGKLLDEIIDMTQELTGFDYSYAITNLVACRPTDGPTSPNRTPRAVEIKACSIRLYDFIDICEAMLVVRVGGPAAKYAEVEGRTVDIRHPAWILRKEDEDEVDLEVKRAALAIVNGMKRVWDL